MRTDELWRAISDREAEEDLERGDGLMYGVAPWTARKALADEIPLGVAGHAVLAGERLEFVEAGSVVHAVFDLDPSETFPATEVLGFTGTGFAPAVPRGLAGSAVATVAGDEAELTAAGETTTLITLQQTMSVSASVFEDPGGKGQGLIFFSGTAEAGATITFDPSGANLVYPEVDVPSADGEWTNGATAGESATNFTAAVAADTRPGKVWQAFEGAAAGSVWIHFPVGDAGNVAITTTSAGNITTGGGTGNGRDAAGRRLAAVIQLVTAHLDQLSTWEIILPFAPDFWGLQARDALGVVVTYDLTVVINTTPDRLTITASNPAQVNIDDEVHIIVMGDA